MVLVIMELGCGRSHVESPQPTSPAIWTHLSALYRHGASFGVKQSPDLDSRIKNQRHLQSSPALRFGLQGHRMVADIVCNHWG